MNNKVNVLGLTFAMAAAVVAMAAAPAQAGTLQVGADPAVITGHSDPNGGGGFQAHKFTIHRTNNGGTLSLQCNTASFEGTTQGQILHEATMTPTFGSAQTAPTGCTLFGQQAQVKANGCKFTLTALGEAANTYRLDIVGCTAATPYIQFKGVVCEVRIPQQNGLSPIVGKNIGANSKEVTLEATVSETTITQVGPVCPDGNNHHSKNGSFTGNTIAKAFKDLGTKEVEKHGHKYLEHLCGEQVTLVSS